MSSSTSVTTSYSTLTSARHGAPLIFAAICCQRAVTSGTHSYEALLAPVDVLEGVGAQEIDQHFRWSQTFGVEELLGRCEQLVRLAPVEVVDLEAEVEIDGHVSNVPRVAG